MEQKNVIDNLREHYSLFSPGERKVADFILRNPEVVIEHTTKELANRSGVSEATVVRMCQHSGYTGYWALRTMLARDIGTLLKKNKSDIEPGHSDAVKNLFEEYAQIMMTLSSNVDAETMRECVKIINDCRQVHIIAVGNTGPLAQHMGFRLGRIGIRNSFSGIAEYFMNSINLADKDDIVIAISQSGVTRTIIQGVKLAKSKGLKVIAISAYGDSQVAQLSDYVLISKGDFSRFDYYKNYRHLSEMAVIEALLDLLTNEETVVEKQADMLEILLSEAKL